ncbi:MAG: hypothetical protein WC342_06435 [Methanoregula sp.]|jgi:archaellum component FlaG (FlaF/FlaG flagellin family)
MKQTVNVLIVCSLLVLALSIAIIQTPVSAASTDVKIPTSGSVMYPGFVVTDGHLIATAASGSTEVKVYYIDGSFYKSVAITNDQRQFDALELSDGSLYFSLYDPAEPGYFRNETVYDYNLATGEKQLIYVTDGPQQQVTKIVADGDHVVMRGGVNSRKLIIYTKSTGSVTTLFTSRDMIHGLAIDGDRIMWGCERVDKEAGREIHVYTISTGTDYIIPESKSENTYGYGDISGDNVVWAMRAKDPDYINGVPVGGVSYDMRLTNLVSGRTQSVDRSDTAPLTVPFISGGTIAYLKQPSLDYDNYDTGVIRTYNIRTGSFNEFGSKIAFITDVKGDLLIWGRYKPMSFFATSLNGTLPIVTPLTPVQSTTQIPGTGQPVTTTPPGSPVDPIMIVSALATGVAGYAVMKRRR